MPRRGKRVAVDLFFRTLADTHGAHATAIVLSGADGDGAIGVKRIKERGGLTIVQDPDEAEHDSMPRSAIATTMVDWVLPVAKMPARNVQFQRNEEQLRLPSEDGPQPAAPSHDEDEKALRGQLRDTVERYEASAEGYRASNEELQAMNDELRSASEDAQGAINEWIGAASNITVRKRAEEAVQPALQEAEQARGEAEAANRSQDHFLAVLSHELRTPLTPVVMALGMINSRTDLPKSVRDALEMIGRKPAPDHGLRCG